MQTENALISHLHTDVCRRANEQVLDLVVLQFFENLQNYHINTALHQIDLQYYVVVKVDGNASFGVVHLRLAAPTLVPRPLAQTNEKSSEETL